MLDDRRVENGGRRGGQGLQDLEGSSRAAETGQALPEPLNSGAMNILLPLIKRAILVAMVD